MAKNIEQKLARGYYINDLLSKEQIAHKLDVSVRTVARWIKDGNWDEVLVAKIAGNDFYIADLRESITEMVRQRLDMNNDPNASAKEKAKLTDEISKINKALDQAVKTGKPSLVQLVHVTESFMNALKQYDKALYLKLLDFQINWLKIQSETHN